MNTPGHHGQAQLITWTASRPPDFIRQKKEDHMEHLHVSKHYKGFFLTLSSGTWLFWFFRRQSHAMAFGKAPETS
jgi:hypothetical protein